MAKKRMIYGTSLVNLSDEDLIASPHGFKTGLEIEELSEKLEEQYRKIAKKINDNKRQAPKGIITSQDASWPGDFGWDNTGANYLLGDGKQVTFRDYTSFRKSVFAELVAGGGKWVLVNDIAQKLKRTDKHVRDAADQLDQMITRQGVSKYIRIIARNQTGKPGAYRVVSRLDDYRAILDSQRSSK